MPFDKHDPLNQFSSRKTAKVVKEADKKVSEQSEQLAFCKWLKHEYPNVLFRSDIQSSSNKSPYAQNLKQILDPYSGWPDVMIYNSDMPNRVGIGIEMKSTTASLSGAHFQNQLAMHKRLEAMGWDIYVCKGCEEAKKIFLEYYGK